MSPVSKGRTRKSTLPCLLTVLRSGIMDDDPSDGEVEDERALELSTVAAIYPELKIDTASDRISATISIEVEPVKPLLLRFPTPAGVPPGSLPTPPNSNDEGTHHENEDSQRLSADYEAHRVSFFPPLDLRITLPDRYPNEKPPLIHLESQYSWLPDKELRALEAAGHALWEEMGKDQVVFSYIDHVREAAEKGFDLARDTGEVLEVPSDLKVALLDFDLKARRAKFEQETFECGICLGRRNDNLAIILANSI